MKRAIDRPVARLVRDLEERGLLSRTLVVIASEFGRDMMTEGKPGNEVKQQVNQPDVITEPKHYGMHRHFTEACSLVVFGGGFKRGFLYGETAPERPCSIVRNPVTVEDFHATIYHALGIPPNAGHVVEQRPVYVTKDGKGKPVMDLLA
jgi:arylsulfatase A-like enzyme